MRNLIVFIFTSIAFTQKSPCRVLIAIEDKRPLLHLQEFGWKPAYMCRSLAGVWTSISRLCRLLAGIRTGICISVQSLAGVWTGTCRLCRLLAGIRTGICRLCRSLAGVWTETCIYVQSLAGVWTGTCLSMLVMLQLMES